MSAVSQSDSAVEIRLGIAGMTCASCVSRVEKGLLRVPGVLNASVNLATEKATVEVLSGVTFSMLAAAVSKAGYTTASLTAQQRETPRNYLPDWWPIALRTCSRSSEQKCEECKVNEL